MLIYWLYNILYLARVLFFINLIIFKYVMGRSNRIPLTSIWIDLFFLSMKTEKEPIMATRSRSAITGKYVKPSYAKSHPKTTVNEKVKSHARSKSKPKK